MSDVSTVHCTTPLSDMSSNVRATFRTGPEEDRPRVATRLDRFRLLHFPSWQKRAWPPQPPPSVLGFSRSIEMRAQTSASVSVERIWWGAEDLDVVLGRDSGNLFGIYLCGVR